MYLPTWFYGLRLVAALAAIAFCLAAPAPAQVVPSLSPTANVTITAASSGTVAAATATATLSAVDGRTNYLCGFAITSTGSTAAAVVAPTVTGLTGGTLTFAYASVAGATLSNQPLVIALPLCVPATAPGVAVAVSMPTLGAGNTNATVNAWGFRY